MLDLICAKCHSKSSRVVPTFNIQARGIEMKRNVMMIGRPRVAYMSENGVILGSGYGYWCLFCTKPLPVAILQYC